MEFPAAFCTRAAVKSVTGNETKRKYQQRRTRTKVRGGRALGEWNTNEKHERKREKNHEN